MTDENILYLSENKKETKSWFQSLGTQKLPLGENKFGFVRSISYQPKAVKGEKVKESFDIKEQDVQQIKSSIPFAPLFPNRIGRLRQLIHDPLPAQQTNPQGRDGSDQTLKNAAYIGKRNEARSILVLVKNIDS